MNTSSHHLKDVVNVAQIGADVFVNTLKLSIPFRGRSVFGGTICAQALHSAIKTIPQDNRFIPNSLHSYFILGGDPELPIHYKVERIRDGGSFLSREVKAYQQNKVIYMQMCSFTLKEPRRPPPTPQPAHGRVAPDNTIDAFEKDFLSASESFQRGVLSKGLLKFPPNTEKVVDSFLNSVVNCNLEKRYKPEYWSYGLDPNHPDKDKTPDQISLDFFWRSKEKIDEELLNYVILAYVSDGLFITQAGKFHGRPGWSSNFNASLDHAIYFHRPFKVNDWLLHHFEQPKSGDSRVLLQADLYTRAHELVATVIQEGLVYIPPKLSPEEYNEYLVERILSAGEEALKEKNALLEGQLDSKREEIDLSNSKANL